MLTNTDKCLGPFFRWRSTAKVRCDGEGPHERHERKYKKKKRERKRNQDLKTKPRTKGFGARTETNLSVYYWNRFEYAPFRVASPPPKKIPKRWAKFNSKPPPNSSCDFLRPYLRRAGSTGVHVHGRTHELVKAPHNSERLEIKRDPRQQARPLRLQ